MAEGSEDIFRTAAFGAPPRLVFSRGRPRSDEVCIEQPILSEIVADVTHVYWVDGEGLVKFPTASSKGHAPEIVSTQFQANATQGRIELAQNAASLFTIIPSVRGGTKVWQVRKDDGTTTLLATVGGQNQDLQAEGRFVYWLRDGQLQRLDVVAQGSPVTLA